VVIANNYNGFGYCIDIGLASSNSTWHNVDVRGNDSGVNFGAIRVSANSSLTIDHSKIRGNNRGFDNFGTLRISNSLLSGNAETTIFTYSGGIADILNCTISGNTGIAGTLRNLGDMSVTNTIVAKNSGPILFNFATLDINYSLLESLNPSGDGNLDGIDTLNIPNFVMPLDPINAPDTGGDYRIKYGPVVGAGINDSISVSDSLDLDGNMRIINQTVDMGAYEFQYIFPCGAYVNLAVDETPVYGTEYNASGIIQSNGTVNNLSGGPVLFEAGVGIELNFNFEEKLGEVFEARIENPCSN
jgi:hypothetical protein